MRISLAPITNVINTNISFRTIVPKLDKRIALIATLIFAAIGAIGFAIYQYRKNRVVVDPKLDKNKELEDLSDVILQKKKQGLNVLTDQDFETAAKAKRLWVVIDGKVYDLTQFKELHPGGEEVLEDVKGRNASRDFKDIGHSDEAIKMMKKYYLGEYVGKNIK